MLKPHWILCCIALATDSLADDGASKLYGNTREHPRVMFVGINVNDVRRSAEFYTQVLGMKIANGKSIAELASQPRGEALVVFDRPGHQAGVMLNWNEESRSAYVIKGSALNRIAIEVADVTAVLEQLRLAGTVITIAPRDLGDYVIGFAEDPDGYPIEFVQVKYGHASATTPATSHQLPAAPADCAP